MDLVHSVVVDLFKEEFAVVRMSFLVVNSDRDVERVLTDADAKENHFDGWQQKLKQEDGEISTKSYEVLLEKRGCLLARLLDPGTFVSKKRVVVFRHSSSLRTIKNPWHVIDDGDVRLVVRVGDWLHASYFRQSVILIQCVKLAQMKEDVF